MQAISSTNKSHSDLAPIACIIRRLNRPSIIFAWRERCDRSSKCPSRKFSGRPQTIPATNDNHPDSESPVHIMNQLDKVGLVVFNGESAHGLGTQSRIRSRCSTQTARDVAQLRLRQVADCSGCPDHCSASSPSTSPLTSRISGSHHHCILCYILSLVAPHHNNPKGAALVHSRRHRLPRTSTRLDATLQGCTTWKRLLPAL